MVNESNKIIVKVGNKSRVQFANSKVYRAITANDLRVLTDKYDDCQIVIIENISEDEQTEVKEFAQEFKSKRDTNVVLFYIPDNDDITSGIADELDYNIYLTDRDLYKCIYDNLGISVSIYLDDRKKFNSVEISESIPEGITDIFGDIEDDTDNDIHNAIAAIDEADKKSNNTSELNDGTNELNVESTNNSNNETENISSDTIELNDKTNNINENTDNSINDIGNIFNTSATNDINKENINEDSNTDKYDNIESNYDYNEMSDDTKQSLSEDVSEYIEELKMKLRDAKYDYKVILSDMRDANKKIASLEDIIRILKEEKQVMEDRYNELVISDDILEDPISLSEYSLLKENENKLDLQVVDLKSTIENLKNALESKDLDINSNETTIEELKNDISDLKDKLSEANKEIEVYEKFKEKAEEYEEELKKVTDEKSKVSNRLEVVEEDNENLHETINDLSFRTDKESETRLKQLELFKKAIIKIKELNNKLTYIENEKDELTNKLNESEYKLDESKKSSREYLDKIAELEKSLSDTDKKIELASSSSNNEIIELKGKINELEILLDTKTKQLKRKENEYNSLINKGGIDENESNALLETNKTLENISKTLREQLNNANIELEQSRKKETEAVKKASGYKAQIDTLQRNLNSLTVAGSMGTIGNVNVKPINLGMSQVQVISVFGSGSFGITTTAISIARKLSNTSNVLYIDFDLVSPMADACFVKNPMLRGIPGTMNGSNRNTGLGIFVEHGVDIISQNLNKVLINIVNNRGGSLHYLSGLYYRPDTNKLANADYSELFKVLGNNFQYIIIDFGRLGCSEIGDMIIKAISDVSYRNVVVTTTNQFEMRNFKDKLTNININLDNTAWLLNLCTTTIVDDKIKRFIGNCKYETIPRMDMLRQQDDFLRSNQTKDRFGLFLDKAVFGR